MTKRSSPSGARVDALAARLLGFVLAGGGLVLCAIAVAITRFDVVRAGSGVAYVVPGSAGRHVIDAAAVTVTGVAGLILLGLSVLGLGFAGWRSAGAAPARPARVGTGFGRRRRSQVILLVGVLTLAVALTVRWHNHRSAVPASDPAMPVIAPSP